MSNNLDHLFKKSLGDRSCQPPPYVWENIERRLERRKQKIGSWWWRSAAAVALLAALTGIWQLKKAAPVQELAIVTEVQHSIPAQPGTIRPEKAVKPITPADDPAIVMARGAIPRPTPAERKAEMPAVIHADYSGEIRNTAPATGLKTEVVRKDFIPLTSKQALQNNLDYRTLLAGNTRQETKEDKNLKLALSGHFVPAYTSGKYSASVKDARGRNYSESQMDGLMNVGGGLRFSVSKGKHLSVQTGIFYSRMGQKTDQHAGPKAAAFSLQNASESVATPLGNIKPKARPVAFRSEEAIVLNNIVNTEQSLEQVFGTLEIPLQVRYNLNDTKFKFSLSGGFSGNFIVNNKVYLKSDSGKELMGSTEDIRSFNLSTDWGVGMEYPLGKKIKIMLEPGFRYFLQSLSHNSQINFKPYMFTLSTGIGIEF